ARRRPAPARARSLPPRRAVVWRRRLLLVLRGLRREADQALAAVERVLAVDADLGRADLDDVVTGPCVAAQAQRRDDAGVHHEEVLEAPGVRHVLVAREH